MNKKNQSRQYFSSLKIILLIVTSLLVSNKNFSQQKEVEKEHDYESHDEEHLSHKNHIVLFIGATTNLSHDETLFTFGGDYEYKPNYFHEKLGIGLGSEFLIGETTEIVAFFPIFYHPINNLSVLIAPLIVFSKEQEVDTNNKMKAYFASRVGINYNIHIKKISISPSLSFDFGETNTILYGVGFGLGF